VAAYTGQAAAGQQTVYSVFGANGSLVGQASPSAAVSDLTG
jgi:hypothetical protein